MTMQRLDSSWCCAVVLVLLLASSCGGSKVVYNEFGQIAKAKPITGNITLSIFGTFPSSIPDAAFLGSAVDADGYVWLLPHLYDRIVRVNTETGAMSGHNSWPSGFSFPTGSFTGGIFDGRRVWIAPWNADRVVTIDTVNFTMQGYDNWPSGFTIGSSAFAGGIFDGRRVWLVPHDADRVISIDTVNYTMIGYSNWPSGFSSGASAKFFGFVFDGRRIWMAPRNADRLVYLDTVMGTMTEMTNWPSGFSLTSIAFDGCAFDSIRRKVWLIPRNADRVISIDVDTMTMAGFNNWPSGYTKQDDAFTGAAFDGRKLWFVPHSANPVISFDVRTHTMQSYSTWPSGFSKGAFAFFSSAFDGRDLFFVPWNANHLVRLAGDGLPSESASDTVTSSAQTTRSLSTSLITSGSESQSDSASHDLSLTESNSLSSSRSPSTFRTGSVSATNSETHSASVLPAPTESASVTSSSSLSQSSTKYRTASKYKSASSSEVWSATASASRSVSALVTDSESKSNSLSVSASKSATVGTPSTALTASLSASAQRGSKSWSSTMRPTWTDTLSFSTTDSITSTLSHSDSFRSATMQLSASPSLTASDLGTSSTSYTHSATQTASVSLSSTDSPTHSPSHTSSNQMTSSRSLSHQAESVSASQSNLASMSFSCNASGSDTSSASASRPARSATTTTSSSLSSDVRSKSESATASLPTGTYHASQSESNSFARSFTLGSLSVTASSSCGSSDSSSFSTDSSVSTSYTIFFTSSASATVPHTITPLHTVSGSLTREHTATMHSSTFSQAHSCTVSRSISSWQTNTHSLSEYKSLSSTRSVTRSRVPTLSASSSSAASTTLSVDHSATVQRSETDEILSESCSHASSNTNSVTYVSATAVPSSSLSGSKLRTVSISASRTKEAASPTLSNTFEMTASGLVSTSRSLSVATRTRHTTAPTASVIWSVTSSAVFTYRTQSLVLTPSQRSATVSAGTETILPSSSPSRSQTLTNGSTTLSRAATVSQSASRRTSTASPTPTASPLRTVSVSPTATLLLTQSIAPNHTYSATDTSSPTKLRGAQVSESPSLSTWSTQSRSSTISPTFVELLPHPIVVTVEGSVLWTQQGTPLVDVSNGTRSLVLNVYPVSQIDGAEVSNRFPAVVYLNLTAFSVAGDVDRNVQLDSSTGSYLPMTVVARTNATRFEDKCVLLLTVVYPTLNVSWQQSIVLLNAVVLQSDESELRAPVPTTCSQQAAVSSAAVAVRNVTFRVSHSEDVACERRLGNHTFLGAPLHAENCSVVCAADVSASEMELVNVVGPHLRMAPVAVWSANALQNGTTTIVSVFAGGALHSVWANASRIEVPATQLEMNLVVTFVDPFSRRVAPLLSIPGVALRTAARDTAGNAFGHGSSLLNDAVVVVMAAPIAMDNRILITVELSAALTDNFTLASEISVSAAPPDGACLASAESSSAFAGTTSTNATLVDSAIPFDLVGSISGCPVDAFPSTGGCAEDGDDTVSVHLAPRGLFAANLGNPASLLVVVRAENETRDCLHVSTTVVSQGELVIRCKLPPWSKAGASAGAADILVVNASTNSTVVVAELRGAVTYGAAVSQCAGSDGVECSGNGRCDAATHSCVCFATAALGFWTGPACSVCAPGAYGEHCDRWCLGVGCSVCNGHGTCSDGRSGSGACACLQDEMHGHWGGTDCGDCASTFFGSSCTTRCVAGANGAVCSGHGACDSGIAGSGACMCTAGFSGFVCSNCAPGHYGQECAPCPSSAGVVCSGHGLCSDGLQGSGQCMCSVGFSNSACDVACPVAFNRTCGWGRCTTNGSCECRERVAHAADGACSACMPGFWGEECMRLCEPCLHGRCNPHTGFCVCDAGYWGTACDSECPGGAANVCSGHGQCNASGICECERSAERGFYVGAACNVCDPLYVSEQCTVRCPTSADGAVCSGRGTCYNGSCSGSCLVGYWGSSCEFQCPGGAAMPCSGRGRCSEATGLCDCQPGVFGTACELRCPGGLGNPCSGRGTCASTGMCECFFDARRGYFSGQDCAVCAAGFTGDNCTVVCNPHSGIVSGGQCVCASGFAGVSCDLPCPRDSFGESCSGHGVCRASAGGTAAACVCDADYYGELCNVPCTAHECEAQGLLRAQCNAVTGACECLASPTRGYFAGSDCGRCAIGFWGTECNAACPCARGACGRFTGRCECPSDDVSGHWNGTDCSVCADGYIGRSCSTQNVELSKVNTADAAVDNDGYPHAGIVFHDAAMGVVVLGSSPIVVFLVGSWGGELTHLQYLPLPAPAVHCQVHNASHLAVTLEGSSPPLLSRVFLDRVRLATGSHPTVAMHRAAGALDVLSGNAVATAVASDGACYASVASGELRVWCGTSSGDAVVWAQEVSTTPRWICFVSPSLLVLSWSLSERSWRLQAIAVDRSARTAHVQFVTNSSFAWIEQCEARRGCGAVSHCVLADNSTEWLFCAAATGLPMGNVVVFVAFNSTSGALLSHNTEGAVLTDAAGVSTAVVDDGYGYALYAYDGPTTAMICRVQFFPLVVVSVLPLERVGLDRPTVLRGTVNASSRTLWLSVATAHVVRAVAINLFSITRLTPSVFDQAGGVTVTVHGVGFVPHPTPLCEFQANETLGEPAPSLASSPAVFVNSTTLLCRAVRVASFSSACSAIRVNVWYGGRSTSTTLVRARRPVTATVERAWTTESGGHAQSRHLVATTITLRGYGFVDGASAATCRLESAVDFVYADMPTQYVNSTTVLCRHPDGLSATAAGARLRYAHDGVVFSTTAAPFAVVGAFASIAVELSSDAPLMAAASVRIHTAIVRTVDTHGNWLGMFDNETRSVRCSAVDPMMLTGDADAERSALQPQPGTTLTAHTQFGVAVFSNLTLRNPPVGPTVLHWYVTTDLLLRTTAVVVIIAGRPARPAFATPSGGWVSGVLDRRLLPAFAVMLVDSVGNQVRDVDMLPTVARLTYEIIEPNATAAAPSITAVATTAQLDRSTALFEFVGVATRSPFGRSVSLTFSVADSEVRALVYTLPQARCDSADEFGVWGAFLCEACPLNGICDGSATLEAAAGYWRGSVQSKYLYACAPPESCRSSTECKAGYEGPTCGSCAADYGRFLATCKHCDSKIGSIMFCLLIVVAVVAVVWVLGLRGLSFTAAEDVDVGLVAVPSQRSAVAIAVKLGLSHLQVLALLPVRLLAASWLSGPLQSSGSWTVLVPDFLNIACAIGRRAYQEMVASVALLVIAAVGTAVIAAFLVRRANATYAAHALRSWRQGRVQYVRELQLPRTQFEQADRVHAEALHGDAHLDAVLKNHRELLDEYSGDAKVHAATQDATCAVAFDTIGPAPSLLRRWVNASTVGVVVLVFLLYPTVVAAAVRALKCTELRLSETQRVRVVAHDPAEDCSGNSYAAWQPFAIGVLAGFAVGVPLLIPLAVLSLQRWTLNGSRERALQLFHFATGSYRVWFWEGIVLARKGAMVAATVLPEDDQTVCVAAFWILSTNLALNVALRPWEQARLGSLEASALTTLSFTSLGLAILTRAPPQLLAGGIVVLVAAANIATMVHIVRVFLQIAGEEAAALLAEKLPGVVDTLQTANIKELRTAVAALRHDIDTVNPARAALLDLIAAHAPVTASNPVDSCVVVRMMDDAALKVSDSHSVVGRPSTTQAEVAFNEVDVAEVLEQIELNDGVMLAHDIMSVRSEDDPIQSISLNATQLSHFCLLDEISMRSLDVDLPLYLADVGVEDIVTPSVRAAAPIAGTRDLKRVPAIGTPRGPLVDRTIGATRIHPSQTLRDGMHHVQQLHAALPRHIMALIADLERCGDSRNDLYCSQRRFLERRMQEALEELFESELVLLSTLVDEPFQQFSSISTLSIDSLDEEGVVSYGTISIASECYAPNHPSQAVFFQDM